MPHGFLGRRGGVSTGEMAGLNVGPGSGDDPQALRENQARAVKAVLPGSQLVLMHQIHSADVAVVTDPWPITARPEGDGMVTDRPGLLLGILTADCAPVLFADEPAGVIGAAHAGWRGALSGVTDAVIEAMETLGANRDRIHAAVGPCIARDSYEVDEAFRARFLADDESNTRFFSQSAGDKPHFDLQAYVAARLAGAGIASVEALHLDTYADEQRFFSFRRATHRGESSYGRQVSLIGLA
ncbi:MAG: peptidoglycan editing factor PgeF [Sphingomicrobium sp.]